MDKCAKCGATFKPSGHTTGYGEMDGKRYCFDCCAIIDAERMAADGRACLYLSMDGNDHSRAKVSNWPGTLQTRVLACWPIRHNWRGVKAYAVRFVGPDGFVWSGRNIGDNQILRAKRTKQLA